MELRSGRLLASRPTPPPGAGRRCRPRLTPGSDGVDRISALPDDVLLEVLLRLRCARAAAHTSLLSTRWRKLWTRLPELSFRQIRPDALDEALRVARLVDSPALSRLEIHINGDYTIQPTNVSFLLDRAARLAPAELVFVVLGYLDLSMKERVHVLRLFIDAPEMYMPNMDMNLIQDKTHLPDFFVLELHLTTCGHVFGAMLLNLLRNCTTIQRLKVVINIGGTRQCGQGCPCDQPQNWRSQYIPLTCLEEVEIGFIGAYHEVDFLKLLCKCAPLMKRVRVTLPQAEWGGEKIYNVFKANPSVQVQCSVYDSSGKQILYSS